MTWRELRAEGFLPIEHTTCGIDEIEETMDEIDITSAFHIDDDGNVVSGVGDRATWLDRKINAWTRTKHWSIH